MGTWMDTQNPIKSSGIQNSNWRAISLIWILVMDSVLGMDSTKTRLAIPGLKVNVFFIYI
jgi:hypothetical protein